MNVFVLMDEIEYDGEALIGVYSSLDKAIAGATHHAKNIYSPRWYHIYSSQVDNRSIPSPVWSSYSSSL